MKVGTFILFALLFFAHTASSQHTVIFEFDSVYQIGGKNDCNKLTVVDLRKEKSNIGYLKVKIFDVTEYIVTEKPLDQSLSEYFDKMLKLSNKGNEELLLVLYDYRVEDKPNGEEIGVIHFDGDFYHGQDDTYRFVGKVDSIYEVSSKTDVTKTLKIAVKKKMGEILALAASTRVTHGETIYSKATAISRRADISNSYPIYKTGDFKKGIYYTVEQFMNNNPVDTPFVVSTYRNDDGVIYNMFVRFLNNKGKKGALLNPEDFYAAYDGELWFISEHSYLSVMSFKENDFYAFRKYNGIMQKTNVYAAGMMFGVVGVLTAMAFDSNKGKSAYYNSKFDPENKTFRPISRVR